MNMQITIFAALFAVLLVIPQNALGGSPEASAQVLRFDFNQGKDGYQYVYQTSNGISGQEQGRFVDAKNQNGNAVVQGQYGYTGTDGKPVNVAYTADENGFHPKIN